ncbi:hypothetical protein [Roseateles terrae]|uniref:Uncharacterized protein n=1 Tax=Roseateles terrae TaxID=431060 RepID=A0ABR6GSE4_9BURK|nr:hypothetical protein [Roseateles terrae]MBB3195037.1 hypothetical protein [Roseateles terrae]OWQ87073.1 hypothetical protein CDN98_09420 [Roseateles terrae]
MAASIAKAQIPVPVEPPPDMPTARKLVYGGAVWQDRRVNEFFGGGSRVTVRATVSEVWRQRYKEQSTDKLMVVYQLTPGPREQFQCQACVPALGAALFAADERGRWQLRARSRLLMEGAPGAGAEDLQMVQLSDDQWALRSRRVDVASGLETRSERLVLDAGLPARAAAAMAPSSPSTSAKASSAPSPRAAKARTPSPGDGAPVEPSVGELSLALNEGFKDKPGPLACGAGAAAQSTGLSVLSPGTGPRVEVVLRFNEGRCPRPEPGVVRQRLLLKDGQFIPDESSAADTPP